MRKLDDIETITERFPDEPLVPGDPMDDSIRALEADGHRVIAIDCASAVIEQCESDDDKPEGCSLEPLRITVRGRDAVQPQELYIHAGRYGLGKVFLRSDGEERAAFWLPHVPDTSVSVRAVIELFRRTMILREGWYLRKVSEPDDDSSRGQYEQDPVLAECAETMRQALDRAEARLGELTTT